MINLERYISLSSCFLIAKISRVHSGFRQYHLSEPNNGQLEEENMQVYARLGLGYCIRAQQVEWKAEEVCYFAWSLILFLYY